MVLVGVSRQFVVVVFKFQFVPVWGLLGVAAPGSLFQLNV